jgi:tripartite-type tricarboxylate transporter receptor subunit TctC
MMRLRRVLPALLIVGSCAAAQAQVPSPSAAPTFPTRTVRLIVPFSAGGAVDVPARIFAPKLQEVWSQGVVVENRPGAGSTIGAEAVAKASPDGHTLLITSNTHLISGSLYRKLPYDPLGDFEPVMELGHAPNVLVVHPSFPANTVAELIDAAKAMPCRGELTTARRATGAHSISSARCLPR